MSDAASSSDEQAVPSPTADFSAYNTELLCAIMAPNKIARSLPGAEDMAFHRSLDRKFSRTVDACAQRILALANQLLDLTARANESEGKSGRGKGRERAKLEDADDVVDRFQSLVVDVTDQLLERADTCMDELAGRHKPAVEMKVAPQPTKKYPPKSAILPNTRLPPEILHASYLPKPQLLFKQPVDNSPDSPWVPSLTSKPNAKVPLTWRPEPGMDVDGEDEELQLSHPYYFENSHLDYPSSMFQPSAPRPPRSFADTPFTWVSTPSALSSMLSKLRTSPEIAIDLEHHDLRSYYGFVCLMQISNREEDWVVDTLALREELEVLNEVFTDPNIVKVLHGAQSDIIWLQRDFNLYIVNLFDTYHASKTLQFPSFGLAFLLELYCDYTADKRFQLADWRIRPLPEEMLAYARSDTHSLLFIYDNLRNALLDRAAGRDELVRAVLELSKHVALQVYQREAYDEAGSERLAKKWNKHFEGAKRTVFRAVHRWRDRVARAEDESLRYVMPNHHIFALAENLPTDRKAFIHTVQGAPSLLYARADELAVLIKTTLADEEARRKAEEEKQLVKEVEQLELGRPLDGAVSAARTSNNRFAVFEEAEVSQGAVPQMDLWSRPEESVTLESSSLFGPIMPMPTEPTIDVSANSSSLFGTPSISTPEADGEGDDRYIAALSRVHGSLFGAPTLAKLKGVAANGNAEMPSAVQTGSAAATEEVPFVPKAARATKQPQVDDSIVVVGQGRNKKRKRGYNLNDALAGVASGSGTPDVDPPQADDDVFPTVSQEDAGFDYSTAPNILDGDGESKKIKKQKKDKKEKGMQFGDFKAPPRARTDPKGGNRSHTFKS